MPPEHEYPVAVTPESTPENAIPAKPNWMHRHPFLTTIMGVGALLIVILGIVTSRLGVQGAVSNTNWSGTNSIFSGGLREATEAARLRAEDAVKRQSTDVELGNIAISNTPVGEEPATDIDFVQLLASLIQPKSATGTVQVDVSSAFSFIPQGLVAAGMPETKRTAEQEVLHSYGNEVGTLVQGFEASHTNSIPTLKDHAEDRGNADKAKLVNNLGYDIAAFGRDLSQMQNVPPAAAAAHSALATTYRLVGTNLTKIAETKTDEQFLDAINTYNASVESLSKRFFVLVSIFTANNVNFTSGEAGSIFMFTPTLSL